MASLTTDFISSISVPLAGRSFQPTAQIRTGELPRMYAMLMATRLSYLPSKSATVSQSAGMGGYPLRPESSQMYRLSSSRLLNGAWEMPSMPTSSVVTPWRTLGSWCGSPRMVSPAWEWMSTKPGHTTRPVASITRSASRLEESPRWIVSVSSVTITAA